MGQNITLANCPPTLKYSESPVAFCFRTDTLSPLTGPHRAPGQKLHMETAWSWHR